MGGPSFARNESWEAQEGGDALQEVSSAVYQGKQTKPATKLPVSNKKTVLFSCKVMERARCLSAVLRSIMNRKMAGQFGRRKKKRRIERPDFFQDAKRSIRGISLFTRDILFLNLLQNC